jgi:hypothetical protein
LWHHERLCLQERHVDAVEPDTTLELLFMAMMVMDACR